MHEFIREPRRCIEPAKHPDRCGGIPGFLLELPRSGFEGLLPGFELACTELQEGLLHRGTLVADHHKPAISQLTDHGYRPWMPYDVLGHQAALGVEFEPLHGEDGAAVHEGHLRRMLHHAHHRSEMPLPPNNANGQRSLVRVENLHKRFDDNEVLKGISIGFAPHRTTVVLGPSGCGKSVLLKHLVGLLRPDNGSVYFDEQRIDTLSERELSSLRRQFGFLFQMGALFDSLNVKQNIEFPLHEVGVNDSAEVDRRINEVLSMVGLDHMKEMMPADLSGGERKRIALARAIVLRPRVILYDEPTTGLDPIRADVINELILKLQSRLQTTSIVVTHDLASAFKLADHMVLMLDGTIVMQGHPDEFKDPSDPDVARFMQGRASEEELAAINASSSTTEVTS